MSDSPKNIVPHIRKDINQLENIIANSSVLVVKKDTVKNLSTKYSKEIGANPEDWVKQNKMLCGLFGSTNTEVRANSYFMIPMNLVEDATNAYMDILRSDTRPPSIVA